jgi:hypothetical protein
MQTGSQSEQLPQEGLERALAARDPPGPTWGSTLLSCTPDLSQTIAASQFPTERERPAS